METPTPLPNQVTDVAIAHTDLGVSDTVGVRKSKSVTGGELFEIELEESQRSKQEYINNVIKKAELLAKVLFWVACVALAASAGYWISEIITTYR